MNYIILDLTKMSLDQLRKAQAWQRAIASTRLEGIETHGLQATAGQQHVVAPSGGDCLGTYGAGIRFTHAFPTGESDLARYPPHLWPHATASGGATEGAGTAHGARIARSARVTRSSTVTGGLCWGSTPFRTGGARCDGHSVQRRRHGSAHTAQ